MKALILPFLFLFSIADAPAQGIDFLRDWEEALALSEKENKPIFMDAYTVWCGPCKMLDRNVFPDGRVGEYFNAHFINLKMDMEKGKGIELAEQFNVRVYPTLLFINSEGEVVHRSAGYQEADQLLELGATALNPEMNLLAMSRRYAQGKRDPDFLRDFAQLSYEAYTGEHGKIAEEYLETQKNWDEEENMRFIFTMVEDVHSPLFTHLRDHQEAYKELFGQEAVNRQMERIIYSSIYALGEVPDLKEVDAIFATSYPEKAGRMSAKYRLRYFLQQDKTNKYAKAAIRYFRDYPSDDPMAYNNEAWNFYELVGKKRFLKKAVQWAERSVALDPGYYNLDTLAALYFKLGMKAEALDAAGRAISAGREAGEDVSGTEKLLEQIKTL